MAKVIVTEIKLGGGDDVNFPNETKAKDFVTLYNQSEESLSLDGWTLQYAKAGTGFETCDAQFAVSSSTALTGTLLSGAVSMPIKRSMNDNTGGAVRIIDVNGFIHDLAGWGATTKCYDGAPAPIPANGKSLQRYIDCDSNAPVDTDNNSADFVVNDTPEPGLLSGPLSNGCEPPPVEEPPEEGGQDGSPEPPVNSCSGIIISELLPNPTGSDTGNEFIELHNPTQGVISLEGCRLSTSANTKLFVFGEVAIDPGQYMAIYNDSSGLTLENSAGGSVFLIDADGSEINQVDYPSNLDDDVSWSLIDGGWVETFSLTPNAPNNLLSEKPCPAGQVRNSETNRCINLAVEAAGLAACKPGQERNPETNRCRNIASISAGLKACDAGQVRNSETNRCRKAEASSLAPCKAGQERNPDTNRCRNASTLSSDDVADVKDVLAATSADKSSWLVAGFTMFGALAYAVWEWRNEITQQLLSVRGKFSL